ncbi:putative RAS-like protein [Sarcoptes scabiei]|nr:putative RAS-like protein [Sarcoptes scabiei]
MNKTAKNLCIIFILISTASISGPFLSPNSSSHQYHGTQIIIHPVELTKDILKDIDYVIVFDGGSTGTRMHIFSFITNQDSKLQKLILDKEEFYHISPGLSSYFNNVSGAAVSIEPLIKKALTSVPAIFAKETPMILKATAGLRLLPKDISNSILDVIEKRFKLLPFEVKSGDVSMLTEQDEGLFAWYTVNFLQHKLHKINESIATLDLGGASTQITFSTYDLYTLVKSSHYIVQRSIEGELEFLYTHSYLGNGLMAARKAILSHNNQFAEKNHSEKNTKNYGYYERTVKSPCFKSLGNETLIWKQDRDIYHIRYNESITNNPWKECLQIVHRFVLRSNIDQPEELKFREIYAMSYFYDRMKDIRVVKHESGRVKIRDFFIYADHVCNGAIKLRKQSPFLCLDLIYIASYLHDGLGLPMNKDIMLVKKINGIETSWALGAAINLFHGYV